MPRVLSAVSQWCGLQAVWEGSMPFIGLSHVIYPEVGHPAQTGHLRVG